MEKDREGSCYSTGLWYPDLLDGLVQTRHCLGSGHSVLTAVERPCLHLGDFAELCPEVSSVARRTCRRDDCHVNAVCVCPAFLFSSARRFGDTQLDGWKHGAGEVVIILGSVSVGEIDAL